jgi:hypothetical protein
MLPKPRRPREKRILPLTRVTYSIEEFCAASGLSRAEVECAIDDGSLRLIKVGNRRLILAPQPRLPEIWQADHPRPNRRRTEPVL